MSSKLLVSIVIIIIGNFCIALFSGVPKLTALYILQHFLSFTNIIHISYGAVGHFKGGHGSAKWTQTFLICELGTWVYLKGYDLEN